MRYLRFATPLGPMTAAAERGALVAIFFEGARHAPAIGRDWIEDARDPALVECAAQLRAYFAGKRTAFELPLAARGTPFQRRVWDAIARIPAGRTLTYTQLAESANAPGCARAAGAATGRNPLAIVVPCHRVVGAHGSLTGYAGGLERKARLLELERGTLRQAA